MTVPGYNSNPHSKLPGCPPAAANDTSKQPPTPSRLTPHHQPARRLPLCYNHHYTPLNSLHCMDAVSPASSYHFSVDCPSCHIRSTPTSSSHRMHFERVTSAHTDVRINNDAKCSHAVFTHTPDTFRTAAIVYKRDSSVCLRSTPTFVLKQFHRITVNPRIPRHRDSYRRMFFSYSN